CAFDCTCAIPLECRAVAETVGRLYPAYQEMAYTGFGDANVVVARDGVWFFEKCERFGYNAHPNLLWNLTREPLGQTFAALVDGTFVPNFSPGFGASCTMYMDHPAPGKAIRLPDEVYPSVYFLDAHKEGDLLLTAGYAESVLLVNAFGYTMPQAWELALARAAQIRFARRTRSSCCRRRSFRPWYPTSSLLFHQRASALHANCRSRVRRASTASGGGSPSKSMKHLRFRRGSSIYSRN